MAAPITYAIDGEQYVAVLAGAGGSHGGHNTELDHDNAGRLLAFKLGAKTPMPVANQRPHKEVSVPRLNVAPEVIDLGRKAYASNCFTCHGLGTHSSGLFPDLKTATAEVHGQWDAIVRGGLRAGKGMPSFADAISAEEAEAIRAYVLDRAWHTPGVLERALDIAVDNLCVPVSWATD